MSILATYPLNTAERKNYSLDYTKWLGTGDVLDSAVAVASPVTAPVLPVTVSVDTVNNLVRLTVGPGGVDGTDYEVKVSATTVGTVDCGSEIKVDCLAFTVSGGC